ncbi:MAG TPA: glycosyltransferase [Thermoanaerobaculia bacterium]
MGGSYITAERVEGLRRPRLLFLQPSLQPPGGGNAVAVCALEVLKEDFEVTVMSWERVRLDAIHRDYAVRLEPRDFQTDYVSRAWPLLLRLFRLRGALLQRYVLMHGARRATGRFDGVVSFDNEIDVGDVPTLQYVHYPWANGTDVDLRARLLYRVPGLMRAYRAVGRAIAAVSPAQIARNVTVVNSDWTGEQFRKLYGGTTTTVYPPLLGTSLPRPWEERDNVFLALGRFAPYKRLEQIIEIVARVRASGNPVRLVIVGSAEPHHAAYARQVREMVAARPWIDLHENLSRPMLDELIGRVRYGLHAMPNEHFGMAAAEMTAAGCIPFLPGDGGQVEVVSRNEQLLYDGVDDAVAKIERVLNDEQLQRSLSAALIDSALRFRRDVFRERIRALAAAAFGLVLVPSSEATLPVAGVPDHAGTGRGRVEKGANATL